MAIDLQKMDKFDEFPINTDVLEHLIRAAFIAAVMERQETINAPDYPELTAFLYAEYHAWLDLAFYCDYCHVEKTPWIKYIVNRLEADYGTENSK